MNGLATDGFVVHNSCDRHGEYKRMAVLTNIPCTISAEATAHVTELGIQREFEQMLDHTLTCIPNLRRVEVALEPPSEDDDEWRIVIASWLPAQGTGPNPTMKQWDEWVINTFSPDVWRHVAMLTFFEAVDGR
jgi:hypothetical protein